MDSLEQLRNLLEVQVRCDEKERVDIVLLDNMTPADLRGAALERDRLCPRIELEASGGVGLESIGEIARTGVNRVSAGGITHHAVWMDIALDVRPVG